MCRILVVDDNDDLREILVEMLSGEGHDVCAAPDGAQALHLAAQHKPSLVLIDRFLPDMDGRDLAEKLRRSLGDQSFLVLVTGDTSARGDGPFDAMLGKPFDPSQLGKLVANLPSC